MRMRWPCTHAVRHEQTIKTVPGRFLRPPRHQQHRNHTRELPTFHVPAGLATRLRGHVLNPLEAPQRWRRGDASAGLAGSPSCLREHLRETKDLAQEDGPSAEVSKPSANPGAIGPKDLLNVKVPAPKRKHAHAA